MALPVRDQMKYWGIASAIFLAMLWFLGDVILPFVLGGAIAYFLDPVADKLFVTAILILLLASYEDLLIPALFIVGREITISALREWMATKGLRDRVAVAWVGKVKTTLQMIAITLLLGASPAVMPLFFHLGLALIWVAAALGLWSMVSYIRAARGEMFSGK